jgi:hypothetical protein
MKESSSMAIHERIVINVIRSSLSMRLMLKVRSSVDRHAPHFHCVADERIVITQGRGCCFQSQGRSVSSEPQAKLAAETTNDARRHIDRH